MHTRKKKDKGEPVFKTSPFRSLKGLKTNESHAVTVPPLVAAQTEPVDDAELFRRAMSGARPVHEAPDDVPAPARRPVQHRNEQAADEDPGAELFLQAMQSMGAGALRAPVDDDEDADAADRRSASSRMRQLKKGTIRIAGELDLHGFLREEALRMLEHFVSAAYARGQQAVLVITGKGINSSEGPVLRGAVDEWLRARAGGMIAEFHPAPRDKGGSGAFVVFLKKK